MSRELSEGIYIFPSDIGLLCVEMKFTSFSVKRSKNIAVRTANIDKRDMPR